MLEDDFPAQNYESWRKLVDADLKGAPFEKRLLTKLIEGITVQPLYSADTVSNVALGFPGQAPLVRGGSPLGATQSGWQIIQEHRHPDPAAANAAISDDLARGASSVLVRLSPRLLDDSSTCGNCGCGGGTLVDTMVQLEAVFKGVDLAKTNVAVTAGPAFYSASALVAGMLDRRGISAKASGVRVNVDPLGALAAKGSGYRNADHLLAEAAELASLTLEGAGVARLQVSTAVYDNAGATAVQELAAAVATGVAYVRACEKAGLSPVKACSLIDFSLAIGCDQFLEMAKLRALRALWNRIQEAMGIEATQRTVRLHARTSRRVLTKRDPWVNLLRTTIGCFSAAIGGADQITVLPFDDVIGHSDDFARRIARNIQIILAEEAHLGKVLDAGGGSFYVETLTRELAEKAWAAFQAIEGQGGMLAALRSGSFKKEVDATWEQRKKDLAKRKTPITGVSEFPNLKEAPVERAAVDTSRIEREIEQTRAQRAADTKISEATAKVSSSKGKARFQAATAASVAGASRLQIENALGREGEKVEAFHLRRFSAGFEKLRDASDAALKNTGKRPRIFLANMGPIAVHTARAMFSQNFFEAGGFEAVQNDGYATAADAAKACKDAGCTLAIICSSDTWYETGAADVAAALKQAGVQTLFLAGSPGEREEAYRKAGIDKFIFMGCDVEATLTELAKTQGILS